MQLQSDAGNVAHNLDRHLAIAESAAERGADLVFFPELSLTGYEPRLAAKLATVLDDERVDVFQ